LVSTWRLSEHIPDSVEIRVTLEGAEIASEFFEVEYEETEYNGRGCDYAYNGEVTLVL
jgi:hypothetical protein